MKKLILLLVFIILSFAHADDGCKFEHPQYIHKCSIKKSGTGFIYCNGKKFDYDLHNSQSGGKNQSIYGWCHTSEHLLLHEYGKSVRQQVCKESILIVNCKAKVVDTLYVACQNPIERFKWFVLTPDDKYLYLASRYYKDYKSYEDNIWTYHFKIIDFKTKKILKDIETPELSFANTQDMMSPDMNKFLIGDWKTSYYDVKENKVVELLDYGRGAAWHPTKDIILFYDYINKEYSILDFKTKKVSSIYKLKRNESYVQCQWTPDGNFVYLCCEQYGLFTWLFPNTGFSRKLDSRGYKQRIIRLSDKKEIKNAIELPLAPTFYWK